MPVFISHRSTDSDKSIAVAKRLEEFNIKTYVDVLDPTLGADHITRKILERLESCTHLLAIISNQTVESWWVPFEIGVATKGERRITPFDISTIALPEFLKIWPVIRQFEQIDLFAKRYLADKLVLEKSYKLYEAKTTSIQTADDFHRLLKSDLGQT